MSSFELDYDILNNPNNLDDFNLTDYYNDFTLFATSESFIDLPFTEANLFPSLESIDSFDGPANAAPPTNKVFLPVRRLHGVIRPSMRVDPARVQAYETLPVPVLRPSLRGETALRPA